MDQENLQFAYKVEFIRRSTLISGVKGHVPDKVYFDRDLVIGDNPIFMKCNSSNCIARNIKKFLEEDEISCLEWPSRSPDLKPIEKVWHYIHQIADMQ